LTRNIGLKYNKIIIKNIKRKKDKEERLILLDNEKIRIIEYEEKYKEKTINFLMNIAINEFGFDDWQDYFEKMNFDVYNEEESKFWLALSKEDEVLGTLGALKISKNGEVKLNSLYVDKNYRKKRSRQKTIPCLYGVCKAKTLQIHYSTYLP